VFEEIQVQERSLQVRLDPDPWVESRADIAASIADDAVEQVPPVGVAAAATGRGAPGRGRGGAAAAPLSSHGRAKWHGDDDDDEWREDHSNELQQFGVAIAAVGIAYLGATEAFKEDPPGAGPVDWDMQTRDPSETLAYDEVREGWYRVGGKLEAENANHDFGWEGVDAEVNELGGEYEVDTEWKISPPV
jgi:hypothetical protein